MDQPIGKPRTDRITAAKVEKALHVQRTRSTHEAAKYMAENGVPVHVAIRVLTSTNRRELADLIEAPPSWRDIISNAGTTFGFPINRV
ncbi:MAG: hypothetical protein ACLGI6_11940 [Gammaproteobacteria bacterium]